MNNFKELNPGCFVHSDFVECFTRMGLVNVEAVFAFDKGKNLHKENLAKFRQRIMFETENPKTTLFLKRYQDTPKLVQIKNWLNRKKILSVSACDIEPAEKLHKLGINTPKTIAFGRQWDGLFEKRSFAITEQIPDSVSLEKKLPNDKDFIKKLAAFVRKFHDTGFRHRDLYLCHIFCNSKCEFTLIDLTRVFKPLFFSEKYRLKDLAQLYYSSPGSTVSRAARLRFFLLYLRKEKLSRSDKITIKKIKAKAAQMAKHDKKHNRPVPYEMR
jgi:hypothetical protein